MKRREHQHRIAQRRHEIVNLDKRITQNPKQEQNSKIQRSIMNQMKQHYGNATANQRPRQAPAISLMRKGKAWRKLGALKRKLPK